MKIDISQHGEDALRDDRGESKIAEIKTEYSSRLLSGIESRNEDAWISEQTQWFLT